ncbi:hypothetical protein HF521_006317 [Silurus meridionalis]|uniref:Uncharacterized protein n=1 Tax=Silurus meridionalis TaxID=175797 RepID=A0A8T0ASZ5_SILME|nr:hypothetical protein HF521_006317 [Silurus meridionalis]
MSRLSRKTTHGKIVLYTRGCQVKSSLLSFQPYTMMYTMKRPISPPSTHEESMHVMEAYAGDDKYLHETRPFPPVPSSRFPHPPPTTFHWFKSSPSSSAYLGHSKPIFPFMNKYKILPRIQSNSNASSADTIKKSSRSRLCGHKCLRSNQEMDGACSETVK